MLPCPVEEGACSFVLLCLQAHHSWGHKSCLPSHTASCTKRRLGCKSPCRAAVQERLKKFSKGLIPETAKPSAIPQIVQVARWVNQPFRGAAKRELYRAKNAPLGMCSGSHRHRSSGTFSPGRGSVGWVWQPGACSPQRICSEWPRGIQLRSWAEAEGGKRWAALGWQHRGR